MAKVIAGRRRYFGHKPTIRPNAKKLYRLFLNRYNMTWEEFSSRIRTLQRGFMGEPKEVRPGRGVFHENLSSCICEDAEAKAKLISVSQKSGEGSVNRDEDVKADDENMNDERELFDPKDANDLSDLAGKILYDETSLDYYVPWSEEPELGDLLSD